jgi:hypothetical protein
MSRRGADEVSGSAALQARMRAGEIWRPAGRATMSADQRDALIMRLTKLAWSDEDIAKATGLTRRGVGMARQRIREGRPGRARGE